MYVFTPPYCFRNLIERQTDIFGNFMLLLPLFIPVGYTNTLHFPLRSKQRRNTPSSSLWVCVNNGWRDGGQCLSFVDPWVITAWDWERPRDRDTSREGDKITLVCVFDCSVFWVRAYERLWWQQCHCVVCFSVWQQLDPNTGRKPVFVDINTVFSVKDKF